MTSIQTDNTENAIDQVVVAQGPALRPATFSIPALPTVAGQIADSGLRVSQQIAADFVAALDMFAVGMSAIFVVWVTHLNFLATERQAHDLLLIAPALAVISMLAFRAAGLHEMRLLIQVSRQSSRLLLVWAFVAVVSASALVLFYGAPVVVLAAWLCLTPVCLLFGRAVAALIFRGLLDRGPLARRVALVGALPGLAKAAHLITGDRLTSLSAVFDLPVDMDAERSGQRIREIVDTLASGDIDDVVILVPSVEEHGLGALIDHLGMLPLQISLLPVIALQSTDPVGPGDTTLLSVPIAPKPISGWSIVFKTAFDYAAAAAIFVLAAVPMLLIAAAIRLESKGPVFFRQHRTGLGGRVFRIWKFRSMHVLEDGTTIKQAEKEDARVTKVGKLIRRLSLDELPQLFNVFAGDMSLVGPRPHARAHDAYYANLIRDYRFRFRVKPGITGLAQINGCRGETRTIEDMAKRVGYDIDYAAEYSLWRDTCIVLLTPFRGVLSTKSY